ncbi:MAG TPA: T9SS type A sorting domain-containing protein [Ignavibacteria bacterium]|nr:T9SS type A sorting domain-containing protein [Ignavibacteria bacterium]
MKNIIIILLFLSSLLITGKVKSQTAELTMSQVNDGVNIDVSVYIRRTSPASFNLGEGSFVITLNNSAINLSGGTILTRGLFDFNTTSNYGAMFTSLYGGTIGRSLETTLNVNPGAEVPTTATLVGVLRFPILNAASNHNLMWHTTFSAAQTDIGDEIGLTFINPENSLLPVELSEFSATAQRNSVKLIWSTISEVNNSHFEIERKSLASENSLFLKIGNIPGVGNSTELKSYSFTDNNLSSGKYKYRLKQVDYNGNFQYYELDNFTEIGVPDKFELSQNYPNPFNPSTKINFQLPVDTYISIRIYDMTGREVSVLINNDLKAGYYTVEFNSVNLASGIYFYKFASEKFVDIKKMVMIK